MSVEGFYYKNVGNVFDIRGRRNYRGKGKSAGINFNGFYSSHRKILRENPADSGSYNKVSVRDSAFLRKIFELAKSFGRKADISGNDSRISGGNIINSRFNGDVKYGSDVGIGKADFPDDPDKSVRGDNRVRSFNSVYASPVYGKGIKTIGGISADNRCRFKVIVRVRFFKSEEFAELFVFALFLFIVDKFLVCFPKLFPNSSFSR